MKNKKVLKIFNFDDDAHTVEFKKFDIMLLGVYFIYQTAVGVLYNLMISKWGILKNYNRPGAITTIEGLITNIIIFLIILLPIFLILRLRNQRIESIGIKLKVFRKDLLWGLLTAIPLLLLNILNDIFLGQKLNSRIDYLMVYFIKTLFFVALSEEIIFRGYIQPRVLTLFKRKYIGVFVVGLIFSLWHIPFKLIRGDIGNTLYLKRDAITCLLTIATHFYLTFVYNKNKSIFAPTIVHAVYNTSLYILG